MFRVDAGGSQPHDARVVRQNAGCHKGVLGAVAAEVHPDVDAPRLAGRPGRPDKAAVAALGKAVGEGLVDDAARRSPLPQNEPVVVHRAGVLLFQLGHELRRQGGVVVNGVGLTIDVGVRVEEFLEPVLGVVRVAGAVKMGVRAGQTAFQHLEHALIPCGDLVAVSVLEGRALNACNVFFVVGTKHIHLAAEQLHNVAGRRGAHDAHQIRPPERPHGLQHVAFQRAQGVAQHDQQPLVPGSKDALRDGDGTVQIGLAGACRAGLDVPAVGAVAEKRLLILSQWHCPHLQAACGRFPVRLHRGPPAGLPRPASSAAPRRRGHRRALRLRPCP